jgi:hypothetical protein
MSSNYPYPYAGDDPMAGGGQALADGDPNRKRIGSAGPQGDNAQSYHLFHQTMGMGDPFSAGVASERQPEHMVNNAHFEAAPARTNIPGNVSPNDGDSKSPSGGPGGQRKVQPDLPNTTESQYESAGTGYPRDIGATNQQTQTRGPDDPFSGGGQNPGHSDRNAWAGSSSMPDFVPIPKANFGANLAKAARPGSLLGIIGALTGNNDEIQNAILQNQWKQQYARDALQAQAMQGRFGYQDQIANIRQQLADVAQQRANQQQPKARTTEQILNDPESTPAERSQAVDTFNTLHPKSQADPIAILLNPNSSPADIKRARDVIALTHPALATQTQSADDIQTSAKALVDALHGDPTAISTLKDLGGFGNKKTAIFAAAKRMDPTFNTSSLERIQKTVQNFTTATNNGSAAMQLRSFNTFVQHAADLQDAVQNVTRTDSQLLNRPLGWIQQQATSDPKYTEFQAALMAPAMEYLRLLNNGGAPYQTEREDMAKMLPTSATVGQVIGATKQMGATVQKRLNSLNTEFKRGTGHDMWTALPDAIAPEARDAAARLGLSLPGASAASNAPAAPGGIIRDKSKSGRPIVSTDGGKTWNYAQ